VLAGASTGEVLLVVLVVLGADAEDVPSSIAAKVLLRGLEEKG